MQSDYQPVNCGFHDQLLHFATLRQVVDVVSSDAANTNFSAKISDVATQDGAEFVHFDNGIVLRLDQLLQVGEYKVDGSKCHI